MEPPVTIKIFTIPFDRKAETFPDEEVNKFLLNKQIREMRWEFFQSSGKPYWTVLVAYDTVLLKTGAETANQLNEPQRVLFDRLRQWRKEKAEKKGIPAYMVATDAQLRAVIHQTPQSVEALRGINGFGKKKADAYGKEIVEMVAAFFERKGPRQKSDGEPRTDSDAPPAKKIDDGPEKKP